jgi:hypothetical protein
MITAGVCCSMTEYNFSALNYLCCTAYNFTVAPLQLSDAVGGVNEGVAVPSIVLFQEQYRSSVPAYRLL